ncbi:protein LONGIFOLIA 1 [Iris pallida]|uniref:Protein LONGIFOLIA 1 n=1 Tax=Iris pallida TaxID=29817 RepID=A0AAX6FL72_IRIPA|nr:protein LONGIFOLIA 1 [Iris pallida]
MAPVVLPPLTDESRLDKQLERQMGCMTGFLQLFDRQQRIYAPKRLASSGSTSPSERSECFPSSPESATPTKTSPTSPLPFPVFDSWKLREAPRLSLDSRLRPRDPRSMPPTEAARADADTDRNRRPTSVVARLMGLDALPELRRSASESRASRDPHRFLDESLFRKPAPAPCSRSKTPPPLPPAKKSFFDACDFFPEVERRLRMRGIDEPAKDLEALKQFLEASQLKGLLHCPGRQGQSRKPDNAPPPIVVLKPGTKLPARRRSEPAKGIRSSRPVPPDPSPRKPRYGQSPPPKPSPKKKAPPPPTVRSPRKETSDRSPQLLRRCDELLRSIAAITIAEQQPSPVSVLDSSFLREGSPPLPMAIARRSITEWEDRPVPDTAGIDVPESDRQDFAYVYDTVRLSHRHGGLDDVYGMVEKRHGADDASEPAVLHRKAMFDAVAAIVVRKQSVSNWEAFSKPNAPPSGERLVREVWLEVVRTRDGVGCAAGAAAGDLDEVTGDAIRKDMAGGDHGWAGASAETTDAVALQIERLVFKDLVAETIGDLADVACGKGLVPWRRKLVF